MGVAGLFDMLLKGRKNLVRKDMDRYVRPMTRKRGRSFSLKRMYGYVYGSCRVVGFDYLSTTRSFAPPPLICTAVRYRDDAIIEI
jgi:hypothetical protein